MAAPVPKLFAWNASLDMSKAKTLLAPPGPPRVATYTMSKIFSSHRIVNVTTTNVVDFSIGTVMRQKVFHRDAPSIADASYISLGMPSRPAEYTIMAKPVHIQIDPSITLNKAVSRNCVMGLGAYARDFTQFRDTALFRV